jgi:methylcytosine dioxygenase
VHKYKLKEDTEEQLLEDICIELTNRVASVYAELAPDSHANMCLFEELAGDCRIGAGSNRPFSGITTVCDFCAHSHKDTNNMVSAEMAD